MMYKRLIENESRLLLAVGVVAAVSLLRVAVAFNINWDEFTYLSQVHAYLGGTLESRLQTLHVHAFAWLPVVSGNEADQVVAARLVMLVLHGLTAFFLYRIAARATDRPSALFAALAYLSLSYVIRGGASFRYDPLLIVLIIAAYDLVVLREADRWRAALGGALIGMAALVTIKALLFAPAFFILLFIPLGGAKAARAVGTAAAGVAAMVFAFMVLYALHDFSLEAARPGAGMVAVAFAKTLRDAGFFPRYSDFLITLRIDLGIWIFLGAGLVLTLLKIPASRGEERRKWLSLAALATPLGALLVYRNAFPYFYGSMLALPAVLTAVAWQALGRSGLTGRPRLLVPLVKLLAIMQLLVNLGIQGVLASQVRPLAHQRQVLAVVHQAFGTPVPCISRAAFVASFPHAGFFMSTWGMENYVAAGERVFVRAVSAVQPPLLVADHPLLDLENKVFPTGTWQRQGLFAEDRAVLAASYIHHWGPLYVAGLRSRIAGQRTVELMIGGRYTLEADCPITIDGARVSPGEVVFLARGSHEFAAAEGPVEVALRWGDRLYRPDQPPAGLPLFLGF